MPRVSKEAMEKLKAFMDSLPEDARNKCALCNQTLTHIVKQAEAQTGAGTATVTRELADRVNENLPPGDQLSGIALRDRVRRGDGSIIANRDNTDPAPTWNCRTCGASHPFPVGPCGQCGSGGDDERESSLPASPGVRRVQRALEAESRERRDSLRKLAAMADSFAGKVDAFAALYRDFMANGSKDERTFAHSVYLKGPRIIRAYMVMGIDAARVQQFFNGGTENGEDQGENETDHGTNIIDV